MLIIQRIKNRDITYIEVPEYKELSVKNVWPKFKNDKFLLQFLPDMKDGQLPERDFFTVYLGQYTKRDKKSVVYCSRNNRSLVEESVEDDKVAIDPEILKELENVLNLRSKFNLQYE